MKKDISQKNITVICSLLMIVTSLMGSLISFSASFGRMEEKDYIAGYKIMFSGETIYSLVLLIVPVMLLLMKNFDSLRAKESLWNLVLPIMSLLILMVIRLNIKDIIEVGNADSWASGVSYKSGFGFSGWVYLISNLIVLSFGIIDYFHLNITERNVKRAIKKKDFSELKKRKRY